MDTSIEGNRGRPFRVVVEEGKIREFARAVKSADPAYVADGPQATSPPTFLAASSFWFQTPSHNIACIGDSKSIRCDTRFVTKYSQPQYKPKGCDVDWGPLGMGPTGRAHVCVRRWRRPLA